MLRGLETWLLHRGRAGRLENTPNHVEAISSSAQSATYNICLLFFSDSARVSSTSNSVPILDETIETNNNRIASADQFLKLGQSYQVDGRNEEAIKFYKKALETDDGDIKAKACQHLVCLYLTLASVCSKDCDYDKAIKWYQKALEISETEPTHHILYEKALTGLGIAMFYVGDTETAIESIKKAQKKIETGNYDLPYFPFV